jgi:galactoside O-acetyltransferase
MDYTERWPDVAIYEPVVILKPEMIEISDGSRIDTFVKIEGGLGVKIGRCVHICSFCHINTGGGQVTIGDHVGVASSAIILGGSNLTTGISMSAASPRELQDVKRCHTVIRNYAFISVGATVLCGVTVGEGAVVAAGAVATKDIPPWEIWAGVPARKIGERHVVSQHG